MKLTQKCKIDFDQWLHAKSSNPNNTYEHQFYNFPFPMQWGVYVDFFELESNIPLDKMMMDIYYSYPGDYNKNMSRIQAIKKANEIYNDE